MSVISVLAKKHEDDVHEWLGGHNSKASGSVWNDQADGRQSRYKQEFAFAWDCKAAMPGTNSIGVTRSMVAKIRHQAHGQRIMLPLRFYSTERGAIEHDLVVVTMNDWREIQERLRDCIG